MKILIAGDFAPRYRVANQIENGDYGCLGQVKRFIQQMDYSIVNFESPVVTHESKPIEKIGPHLCCTEKAVDCIVQAGFNCITLANNHFRDYGQIGVEDTINACEKHHIDYVGGGKNKQDAERVLYKTLEGKVLAIINVCDHEWSITSENHGGSNPLNPIRNYYAIQEAKNNSDYLLVIVHGGIEGYNLPTPRMQETYRFFIDVGADAVVNHHQHCYSGYEMYHGKPIFYGLGNFCFDTSSVYRNDLWMNGFMVVLEFSETTDFMMLPYKQCEEDNPIVNMQVDKDVFSSSIEQLSFVIAEKSKLEQQYRKITTQDFSITKNILAPYSNGIIRKFYAKGLLPSFATKVRKKQLLNYIQCESHRDRLLQELFHGCNSL